MNSSAGHVLVKKKIPVFSTYSSSMRHTALQVAAYGTSGSVIRHYRWRHTALQVAAYGTTGGGIRHYRWWHTALQVVAYGTTGGVIRHYRWWHTTLQVASYGTTGGGIRHYRWWHTALHVAASRMNAKKNTPFRLPMLDLSKIVAPPPPHPTF